MLLLSSEKIVHYLPEEYKFLKIHLFDRADSTNNVAKNLIAQNDNTPFLVIAESQSAGKGRLGRSFYSPASTGIYMSIALGGFSSLPDASFITPAAAVAVTDAIETLSGKKTDIKWVNDIYLEGKKICGILAESQPSGNKFSVITGIGLNMTTEDFPPELKNIAGSLKTDISREQMIAEITKNLFTILKNPKDKSFMDRYKSRSIVLNKDIYFYLSGVKCSGKVIGIQDSGELKVLTEENTTITLSGGEITVRIK